MAEKDWIAKYFAPLAPDGLQDDVALIAASGPSIITCDMIIEGVHFLATDPTGTVARKLVRRNVSDIHAKGARPRAALLSLGWPAGRPEEDLADFARGLRDDLIFWGIRLVGGDTASSPAGLFASLTLTGDLEGRTVPVRRSGAQPGDRVWVTGRIGAACLGFDALAAGSSDLDTILEYRVPAVPPLAAARLVSAAASASIDISDGLFADGLALANASGVRLRLDLDRVPFAAATATLGEQLRLAGWGDDYQILFTAPDGSGDRIKAAARGFAVAEIGQIEAGSGIIVLSQNTPINLPETLGFEHGQIGLPDTRP